MTIFIIKEAIVAITVVMVAIVKTIIIVVITETIVVVIVAVIVVVVAETIVAVIVVYLHYFMDISNQRRHYLWIHL